MAADRDVLENPDFTKTVSIVFEGSTATVSNNAGVSVTQGAIGAHLTIASDIKGVEYILTGNSTNGFVQITSSKPTKVTLNGVSLTSPDGPAVSMISSDRNYVVLADGSTNSLTDAGVYTRGGSAPLHASGPLILSGKGALTVAGLKSHGVNSNKYIRVLGGEVKVAAAAKDGFHANDYIQVDGGSISTEATGDGMDADTGFLVINGGGIAIRGTVADTRGLKSDGPITINGGSLRISASGAQSKGISSKAAVKITGGTLLLNLSGEVVLTPVTTATTTYSDPSYCTGIKSETDITISGGTTVITHSGVAGKGLSAGGNISVSGGAVDVAVSGNPSTAFTNADGGSDTASADCFKADGTLTIAAGTVIASSTGTEGDCLSSDLALAISGGNVNATVKGSGGSAIASALGVDITGGNIEITASGPASKGINSQADLVIGGGTLTCSMSGAVVLETVTTTAKNPTYSTALKADANVSITNGTITITHTGVAGKGLSVDGDLSITGGTLGITTSGNASATFTNISNATDIAAADCIKVDGTLTITGGTVSAISSGTGADAISAEGVTVVGTPGVDNTPIITARTSGARVLVSGSGNSANYANCKAFSTGANLTINGGQYTGSTTTVGAEGLESKANLTINGGTVEITSYDDGINAAASLTVNGGVIYSYASNNDGIDSNGTFRFTGGTIISSGASAPEEGFDCDANNFTITGGTLIGTGGASSTPTAASSSQRTILYKATGTAGTILQVKANGTTVMIYKIPRSYTGGTTSMTMLITLPLLASGVTYTIHSGGTVSGGTEFHGYYTGGATVTGSPTLLKTFTLGTAAGSVTTVQ